MTTPADPCPRCAGCGQIASGDEGAPWSAWLNLPIQSSAAVLAGLVHPLPCPACGGKGTVDSPDAQMSITEQCARLRQFAQAVLRGWPEGAPDPCELQDLASAAGLLRPETRREPCGEECNCVGYDDFPLVCYRRTALLTGKGRDDEYRFQSEVGRAMSTPLDDDQIHAALCVYCYKMAGVEYAFSAWLSSTAANTNSSLALIDALRDLNAAVDYVIAEGALNDLRLWTKNDFW